ncbi:MAG: sporulation membrane protein YtaF [Eubacteriales bacterium]|nr:sporulation membrane protein YtaF [Bacillota bacterium]MBV1769512.1 sporulation membrane protein YtaF [Desulforudis sp.]MDP3049886.1 sporulation membrane protein YtaF [Eubacteriales bacterium]MDQ7788941.1 sporulation membrane protein YtaF [Clostridia bacterium]MDZ4044049.1 sporulation membrane protein YtaF [Eubacteriales bacterium]
MELVALLVFGVALSLDGFAAGLAYGLRRIQMPFLSLMIICLTSGIAISISLGLGFAAAQVMAPEAAQVIGGILLIFLGVWILNQALRRITRRPLCIRIPPFGMVIQVLFEPLDADMDQSGAICSREALILGIALALDAFAAGFAIALSGLHSIFVPLFVTVGLFLLINLGILLGQRTSDVLSEKVNLLPGCLLIMLGMFRLI